MGPTERVIRVIETVVAHQQTGIRFADIVLQTGLSKATIHRILKELVDLEVLTLSDEVKRYRASLKLASLGAGIIANFDLRDHVHPQLIRLHQETKHICNMAIKQGDVGIYVDKIESQDYGIKLFSEVGKSFPLHATALGKVLLAACDTAEQKRILSGPLAAFTPNTITAPRALLGQLALIRREGHAVDNEEITRGIVCIAAPVTGPGGEVICAISVTFPAYICEDQDLAAQVRVLKKHAAALSGQSRMAWRLSEGAAPAARAP
jgi:DNA-binding IclR family transcriptional regulator